MNSAMHAESARVAADSTLPAAAGGYGVAMPDQDTADDNPIAEASRKLRAAEDRVRARRADWEQSIQDRDRLILWAFFKVGLRPFLIAEKTGVGNSTVHLVLRGEKARRKQEGLPIARGADKSKTQGE